MFYGGSSEKGKWTGYSGIAGRIQPVAFSTCYWGWTNVPYFIKKPTEISFPPFNLYMHILYAFYTLFLQSTYIVCPCNSCIMCYAYNITLSECIYGGKFGARKMALTWRIISMNRTKGDEKLKLVFSGWNSRMRNLILVLHGQDFIWIYTNVVRD